MDLKTNHPHTKVAFNSRIGDKLYQVMNLVKEAGTPGPLKSFSQNQRYFNFFSKFATLLDILNVHILSKSEY